MKTRYFTVFFPILLKGVLAYGQLTPSNDNSYHKASSFYAAIRWSNMPGYGADGETHNGISLLGSFGITFNPLWAFGIGGGLEYFGGEPIESVYTFPVFAETRGYWFQKRSSPFHLLAVGYGFAQDPKGENQEWGEYYDARGGLFAKAAIGMRFGRHFTLHFGYAHQQKTLRQGWEGFRVTHRIQHQRMEAGVGIVF